MVMAVWLSNSPTKAANDHLTPAKPFAHTLYLRQGGNARQWRCLVKLWTMESNWRVAAVNKDGGARGIPQALPASKMAQFGRDYKYDYQTQIRWGLRYIKTHWNNNACNALAHEKRVGWY